MMKKIFFPRCFLYSIYKYIYLVSETDKFGDLKRFVLVFPLESVDAVCHPLR